MRQFSYLVDLIKKMQKGNSLSLSEQKGTVQYSI